MSQARSPRHIKVTKTIETTTEVSSDNESVGSLKESKSGDPIQDRALSRLNDTEIKLFNSITNFVDDIASYLSSVNKNTPAVARYNELLRKTKLIHKKNIRKHISVFQAFIDTNKDAIISKDINSITGQIQFSNNVYLDFKDILKRCDADSKKVIIEHLLNIQYQFNPSDDIKNKLMELIQSSGGGECNTAITNNDPNNDFGNIFRLIEQNVDKDDPNPMSQIMKMIGSPAFGQILNEVKKSAENGGLGNMLSMIGQGARAR